MENEIMNYEDEAMDVEIVDDTETERSGMSVGKAVLLTAGLTFAAAAVVKLVKKQWAKHKAKKELRLVEEDECIEPTDEEIDEVTK